MNTYADDAGNERPDRRRRDRSAEDPRIAHLFNGFDNLIANADAYDAGYLKAMRREFAQLIAAPIDMVMHCPACGMQHIDEPEPIRVLPPECGDFTMLGSRIVNEINPDRWKNPPHRSHLCHGCGRIWRPADVPTNGVAAIKTRGKNDSSVVAPAPAAVPERTMFDVAYGPRTVYGQVTLGFVLGVRLPDKDVLVFGATVDETRAAAALLGSELFGVPMVEKRAMLLREGSTK